MFYKIQFTGAQKRSPEMRMFGLNECAGGIHRQETLQRFRFQRVAAVWLCTEPTFEKPPMRTPSSLSTQNVCC
jgi:hypothetical protein